MQAIYDDSDLSKHLRRYRTELPNMADDDLNLYQYRLYGHYKRVCGANGGTCYEAVRTTADKCGMSIEKLIQSRQELAKNGWITLTQDSKGTYQIQIVDRWVENFQRYGSSKGSDFAITVDRYTDQSEATLIGIPITTDRQAETKKEPIKKEQIPPVAVQQVLVDVEDITPPTKKPSKPKTSKTEGNPNTKPLVELLERLRGGNIAGWAKEASWAKKIAESEGELTQADLLRLVEGCYIWLKALSKYWENKAVSLSDLYEYLPQYKDYLKKMKIQPGQNSQVSEKKAFKQWLLKTYQIDNPVYIDKPEVELRREFERARASV